MVFSGQFSLSMELTRLIPLGPLVETSARTLMKLARSLQDSGSDVMLEKQLAEVFGRNQIEKRFESSFRAVVKRSSQTPLKLLDVVLQAGAGPTVQRSLSDRAYLSSLCQLALLTYVHELDSLTRSLIRAFGQRRVGSNGGDDDDDLPDYNVLFRALGTIRDQTTSYRWDLIFSAVEKQLYDSLQRHNYVHYMRQLPFAALQGLLDAFTAIQFFPEKQLLRIRVMLGVSTIIVWAHHVLGMTVSVIRDSKVLCRFGTGIEQVSIEWLDTDSAPENEMISIFRSSDMNEPEFSLSTNPGTDSPLVAVCRHPALGFGVQFMKWSGIYSIDQQTKLAEVIMAACIATVRAKEKSLKDTQKMPALQEFVPSRSRLSDVASLLFAGLEYSYSRIDEYILNPDLQESVRINLPTGRYADLRGRADINLNGSGNPLRPEVLVKLGIAPAADQDNAAAAIEMIEHVTRYMVPVLVAMCSVANLADCAELPIHYDGVYRLRNYLVQYPAYNPSRAWEVLTTLLSGIDITRDKRTNMAVVYSSSGWSLAFQSAQKGQPVDAGNEIYVYQGVPARGNHRRAWVLDMVERGYLIPTAKGDYGQFRADHWAGQRIRLESGILANFKNPLISGSGEAFEIARYMELKVRPVVDNRNEAAQIGARGLQTLCWRTIPIPDCEHGSKTGDVVEVPEGCVVFSGWKASPITEEEQAKGYGRLIEVAMTAGSPAAQWAVLFAVTRDEWNRHQVRPNVYLRRNDCCLSCAVDNVRKDPRDFPKLIIL